MVDCGLAYFLKLKWKVCTTGMLFSVSCPRSCSSPAIGCLSMQLDAESSHETQKREESDLPLETRPSPQRASSEPLTS